jgi:hypothetical protein
LLFATVLTLILANSRTTDYLAQIVANSTVILLIITESASTSFKFIFISTDDGAAHI